MKKTLALLLAIGGTTSFAVPSEKHVFKPYHITDYYTKHCGWKIEYLKHHALRMRNMFYKETISNEQINIRIDILKRQSDEPVLDDYAKMVPYTHSAIEDLHNLIEKAQNTKPRFTEAEILEMPEHVIPKIEQEAARRHSIREIIKIAQLGFSDIKKNLINLELDQRKNQERIEETFEETTERLSELYFWKELLEGLRNELGDLQPIKNITLDPDPLEQIEQGFQYLNSPKFQSQFESIISKYNNRLRSHDPLKSLHSLGLRNRMIFLNIAESCRSIWYTPEQEFLHRYEIGDDPVDEVENGSTIRDNFEKAKKFFLSNMTPWIRPWLTEQSKAGKFNHRGFCGIIKEDTLGKKFDHLGFCDEPGKVFPFRSTHKHCKILQEGNIPGTFSHKITIAEESYELVPSTICKDISEIYTYLNDAEIYACHCLRALGVVVFKPITALIDDANHMLTWINSGIFLEENRINDLPIEIDEDKEIQSLLQGCLLEWKDRMTEIKKFTDEHLFLTPNNPQAPAAQIGDGEEE